MKWIYLLLAIFAAIMAVVTAFFGDPKETSEGLRVCITASVVNFGLFYAIRWAQKKKNPEKKEPGWWKIRV
jgi:uncharacterized membrane-anchored protein